MNYRIATPGYEGFTGDLGGVEFVDGVTARDYPIAFIDRLSANFLIVEAESGAFAGLVTRLAETAAIPFVAPTDLEQMSDEQIAIANQAAVQKSARIVTLDEVFTREQLEAIADKKGIAGLREIAAPYGVKDKSITGLIEAVLKAQDVAQSTTRVQVAGGASPDPKVVPGVTKVAQALPGEGEIVAVELSATLVAPTEAPADAPAGDAPAAETPVA